MVNGSYEMYESETNSWIPVTGTAGLDFYENMVALQHQGIKIRNVVVPEGYDDIRNAASNYASSSYYQGRLNQFVASGKVVKDANGNYSVPDYTTLTPSEREILGRIGNIQIPQDQVGVLTNNTPKYDRTLTTNRPVVQQNTIPTLQQLSQRQDSQNINPFSSVKYTQYGGMSMKEPTSIVNRFGTTITTTYPSAGAKEPTSTNMNPFIRNFENKILSPVSKQLGIIAETNYPIKQTINLGVGFVEMGTILLTKGAMGLAKPTVESTKYIFSETGKGNIEPIKDFASQLIIGGAIGTFFEPTITYKSIKYGGSRTMGLTLSEDVSLAETRGIVTKIREPSAFEKFINPDAKPKISAEYIYDANPINKISKGGILEDSAKLDIESAIKIKISEAGKDIKTTYVKAKSTISPIDTEAKLFFSKTKALVLDTKQTIYSQSIIKKIGEFKSPTPVDLDIIINDIPGKVKVDYAEVYKSRSLGASLKPKAIMQSSDISTMFRQVVAEPPKAVNIYDSAKNFKDIYASDFKTPAQKTIDMLPKPFEPPKISNRGLLTIEKSMGKIVEQTPTIQIDKIASRIAKSEIKGINPPSVFTASKIGYAFAMASPKVDIKQRVGLQQNTESLHKNVKLESQFTDMFKNPKPIVGLKHNVIQIIKPIQMNKQDFSLKFKFAPYTQTQQTTIEKTKETLPPMPTFNPMISTPPKPFIMHTSDSSSSLAKKMKITGFGGKRTFEYSKNIGGIVTKSHSLKNKSLLTGFELRG